MSAPVLGDAAGLLTYNQYRQIHMRNECVPFSVTSVLRWQWSRRKSYDGKNGRLILLQRADENVAECSLVARFAPPCRECFDCRLRHVRMVVARSRAHSEKATRRLTSIMAATPASHRNRVRSVAHTQADIFVPVETQPLL